MASVVVDVNGWHVSSYMPLTHGLLCDVDLFIGNAACERWDINVFNFNLINFNLGTPSSRDGTGC